MKTKDLKILFASYECAPFFKMGGLGDVAGSLPKEIEKLGADIRVVIPYYKVVKEKFPELKKIAGKKVEAGGKIVALNIFEGKLPDSKVPIYFLDTKYFRVPNIFKGERKHRFVLFSKLVTLLPEILDWNPQVIHANDWHTGAVPLLLKKSNSSIKILYTIHNIGYPGRVLLGILNKFGIYNKDISEVKNGRVNIMREAILASDKISTVSPTYAREILTREYGYDMSDALRKRKKDLFGIINGLDYSVFNPATDKFVKRKFTPEKLNLKVVNKKYLQKISGLAEKKDIPIIGMVSRLAGQKGFNILSEVIDDIMLHEVQFVILGTGEERYHKLFKKLNRKYKGKFKAHMKFSINLASDIYAGADLFLMPSLYEPCGLGQLIAMKYGTIPIVRATGGLADTVAKDVGFSFKKYEAVDLLKAVREALTKYADEKTFVKMQKRAMKCDFSWGTSARKYLKIYLKLAKN